MTPTHAVADGMHSAIIRATKSRDAVPIPHMSATLATEPGCCGGTGCC